MTDTENPRITAANLITVLKAVVVGIMAGECFFLLRAFGRRILGFLSESLSIQQIAVVLTVFLLLAALFPVRHLRPLLGKIVRSHRFDVLFALALGILVDVSFAGLGSGLYTGVADSLSPAGIAILCTVPVWLELFLQLRRTQLLAKPKPDSELSFFLNDAEITCREDDLLGYAAQAEIFAERVLNGGSTESLVFGVDAPWGAGKSSFVNLCEECWKTNKSESPLAFKFSPIRYENRSDLPERFVDELIRAIRRCEFEPEIRPLFSRYSSFIKGIKGSFSFLGFEILSANCSIDQALEDLKTVLSQVGRKIIVIVDDLDRISLESIKDMLFAVKKCFALPNVSYVLCYDTQNIDAMENKSKDSEKVSEFLEKFVNIKICLCVDAEMLDSYVSTNLNRALVGNVCAEPELVSKAVGGLRSIIKSSDLLAYLPFVRDIRKIKRFINTVLLFDIHKTDFDNADFNSYDLTHLLLIYVYYPGIFRDIYVTETGGKRGFFSLVLPFEDGYPPESDQQMNALHDSRNRYANSTRYNDYLGSVKDKQRFLLDRVFSASQRLEDKSLEEIPDEARTSNACFNGSPYNPGRRNLERYLNLIVSMSKPPRRAQSQFYRNCRDKVFEGKSVEHVLAEPHFAFSENESSHLELWRAITNSAHDMKADVARDVIVFLLHTIQQYSMFSVSGITSGLRDTLPFFLAKLLDSAGWSDPYGSHMHNTDEYVVEIAEWIFGEGNHQTSGIVETLGQEERGVLGFHDLLAFRHSCCLDKSSDIFNLQRALSKHGDPNAPAKGPVSRIAIEEMRELSQRVFGIFNKRFIDPQKNIIALIDELTLSDLTSEYHEHLKREVALGRVKNIEQSTAVAKAGMKSFILYQLVNSEIESGPSCGYYDESGKADQQGIRAAMQDYLFSTCFSPEQSNYRHFVRFLLENLALVHGSARHSEWAPSLTRYEGYFDRARLAEYWLEHGDRIRAIEFDEGEAVHTINYVASYKANVDAIYELLDKLVQARGADI